MIVPVRGSAAAYGMAYYYYTQKRLFVGYTFVFLSCKMCIFFTLLVRSEIETHRFQPGYASILPRFAALFNRFGCLESEKNISSSWPDSWFRKDDMHDGSVFHFQVSAGNLCSSGAMPWEESGPTR